MQKPEARKGVAGVQHHAYRLDAPGAVGGNSGMAHGVHWTGTRSAGGGHLVEGFMTVVQTALRDAGMGSP